MASSTTQQPRLILFDLLTALLDSWSIWSASIPASHTNITTGEVWRKQYLNLTYGCGSYHPYESLVSQSAIDVGLPPSAPAALLKNWDELAPWPEVPKILRMLRERGVRMGVVTNCSTELGLRAVRNLEGVVGEGFKFEVVVTAEGSGQYKPARKPYEDALKEFGLGGEGTGRNEKGNLIGAEQVLFVAGSASDIPGAGAVGMRVVWNNHVGLPPKGDGDYQAEREGRDLGEALEGIFD